MKKILSILIVLTVCIGLFAGCVQNSPVVATIEGNKITKDEYVYYLKYAIQTFEAENGTDAWETEIDGKKATDIVSENAMKHITDIQAGIKKAKELNVSLSEQDIKDIKSKKAETINQYGGAAAFNKALKDAGLTEKLYDKMVEQNTLMSKVYSAIYGENGTAKISDTELKAYFDKNYVKAKHVLRFTVNQETRQALSETEVAAAKKTAENVRDKAKKGDDFDALIKEFNQDPGAATSPGGYVFTKGEMYLAFEEATYKLKVGEVSDLVLTDAGYHVIKRLALTDEDFKAKKEDVRSVISGDKFEKDLKEWAKALTIVYTNAYSKINPIDYKQKPQAETQQEQQAQTPAK